MPANSNPGFRVNNVADNQRIMNVARGAAYYGTNGRTPTANVPLNEAATIVTRTAFETSAYCALIRETYGTYENYIAKEYLVKFPQKLGAFSLPDGKTMCEKYGPMTAPTKNGGSKYKYQALNWALTVAMNGDGVGQGDWHLWDVREGSIMMRDENLALINATRQKMGITQISNATYRWFAERCGVGYAWYFGGANGTLDGDGVNRGFQVGAVTLLRIK